MMTFKDLHHQDQPLLLANIWDVPGAQLAEEMGFRAIGTSSAAIAKMLGYRDGEDISFAEMEYIVKRIAANCDLPITVDMESGYSRDPSAIVSYINRLIECGVSGINLEDSIVDHDRNLQEANSFAYQLSHITKTIHRQFPDFFFNVRTDTFLLDIVNKVPETRKRIKLYEEAGANGIFIPCLTDCATIMELVESTSLPLNVMCMPDLPDFEKLKQLGVKRISMGNFIFEYIQQQLKTVTGNIVSQQSFKPVFS